jgi:hypothetical protein
MTAAGAALAFLVAAIAWGIPFLDRDREAHTGTPTPPPYAEVTPIVLKPGEVACLDSVAVEPSTRVVRLLAASQPVGVPLRVTARGDGWRSESTTSDAYGGTDPIHAPLSPPPHALLAKVCVENVGERRVRLQGTIEARVQSRSRTAIDGEPIEPRMSLILLEEAPAPIVDRIGTILDHVAAFDPPFIGSFSVALLLALLVAGVPAAVVFALWRSLRDDDHSE